jgi:UDP:flavonoid glycosyltransferase YjiC (YdhE family)
MARILFCWELGGDLGHLSQLLPLADALARRGHHVALALKPQAAVESLGHVPNLRRFDAPQLKITRALEEPPRNFADVLYASGYAEPAALVRAITAWRALYDDFTPDWVVAAYAPTALLALRDTAVPRVTLGNGFELPPPVDPWPSLRPWMPVSQTALRAADARVLVNVNQALEQIRTTPLAHLHDLFAAQAHFLLTLAELDPYAPRSAMEYLGSLPTPFATHLTPQWPSGSGPKVFAYLKGAYPQGRAMLEALATSGAPCLAYYAGTESSPALTNAPNLACYREPVNTALALEEADVVVCHAGGGLLVQALLAGKPLLLLPTQFEQFLSARSVTKLGCGSIIPAAATEATYRGAIERALREPLFRDNAQTFARKYAHLRERDPVGALASRCEALMSGAA